MPYTTKDWTRFNHNGTPIYVRPNAPDWFVPNAAGDDLLQTLHKKPGATISLEEELFLRRLPDIEVTPYAGRAAHLSLDTLQELWLHITSRCNLRCGHCLFSSSDATQEELSLNQITQHIDDARGLGCSVFALTGGEPMMHPHFKEIINDILKDPASHAVVLTNGTLIPDQLEAISSWPRDRFHLQLSLDGLRKRHDQQRGAGTYDRLMNTLRLLRTIEQPFTLSMCITSDTVNDVPGIIDLAARQGAANVHLMWCFVRGRAESNDFVDPLQIRPLLLDAINRADYHGITIDNIEAIRAQVFAPSGTRIDGTSAGWESVAIGPDNMLYPTPAQIGVAAMATSLQDGLAAAWRQSDILEDLRHATVADMDAPMRFLLGGGDLDHSLAHSGTPMGNDPFEALKQSLMLEMICREAAAQPVDGAPALRLKMGDILEQCAVHGEVALLHTNCLLSAAGTDSRSQIGSYYSSAAQVEKEEILNPACYPPEMLAHIPEAYRVRGYGCGSPVQEANLQPGETVVDLGCGAGVECFISAKQVGPTGNVIGIDMLDPMLARATTGAAYVRKSLGYDNLNFKKGFLEQIPMPDASADVILSNCVLNLSTNKRKLFAEIVRVLKPGGRLVVSDVVCDKLPSASIRNDATLQGECIAGALTQTDLYAQLQECGLVGTRAHKRFPYRVVQEHSFYSLTFESRKPVAESKPTALLYRGPFRAVVSQDGTLIEAGKTVYLPLAESVAFGEEVFTFDNHGMVNNIKLEGGCCTTSAPEPAPASSGCCTSTPEEASAGCGCGNEEDTSVDCSSSAAQVCGCNETPPGARHKSDCLLCGAPVIYKTTPTALPCSICGTTALTEASCEAGHYICDTCHAGEAATALTMLETSIETDMTAMLTRLRKLPAFAMHGPEHHALVPAIIITAYRNAGGAIPQHALKTALARGAKVPGGACGLFGACGAAIGVGIAFSILLEATPVDGDLRARSMQATAQTLQAMAARGGARCCLRESWTSLQTAAELSRVWLPIQLQASDNHACEQYMNNHECLKAGCPLWPANVEKRVR